MGLLPPKSDEGLLPPPALPPRKLENGLPEGREGAAGAAEDEGAALDLGLKAFMIAPKKRWLCVCVCRSSAVAYALSTEVERAIAAASMAIVAAFFIIMLSKWKPGVSPLLFHHRTDRPAS